MRFLLLGNPLPKQRPRSSKGRFYSPSTPEEQRIAAHLEAQMDYKAPSSEDVSITVRFYRANKRRVDLDNLLKLVLDAANGVIWEDDFSVKQIQARMSIDKNHPRTEMEVVTLDTP